MSFDKDRFRDAMGTITVIDLADKLGCSKSLVSMYLSGQREPSKMAVQLISLILGVNPAWLAGLDVDRYSNAKIVSRDYRPLPSEVTPEEESIIVLYRKASDRDKKIIRDILQEYGEG